MKLQYICKECNRPFNSPKALGAHVAIKHDAHEYYDTYCKNDGEGVCATCGKPTKFRKLSYGYDICCSKECALKLDHSHYQYNALAIEIKWQRDLQQIQQIYNREQRVSYNCKLCGEPVIMRIRYITGLVCIKCKRRWGNLRSFGEENPFQSEKIKNDIGVTNLNKYGVTNYSSCRLAKERRTEYWMKHFNVPHYMCTEQFKEAARQTNVLRYGAPYQVSRVDFLRLFRDACEERYNVRHPSQCPEIRRKQLFGKYVAPNGRMYDSSWEYMFEQYLNEHNISYEYQPNISFEWHDVNHKLHKYFPDFLIKGTENTIIEIKGDHFFDANGNFIDPYDTSSNGRMNAELKFQCMKRNGILIYTSKELKQLGIKI